MPISRKIMGVSRGGVSKKAIFGYGYTASNVSMSNLVTSSGVIGSDVTGVGTGRQYLAASSYGS